MTKALSAMAAPAVFTAANDLEAQERTYTIGDLSREYGVTLRTLRFYEDRGLLAPQRKGTARIYSEQDRARLEVILKGKQLGFTLTEIAAMVEGEADLNLTLDQVNDQIAHLRAQKAEIEAALAELEATRARLTKARLVSK